MVLASMERRRRNCIVDIGRWLIMWYARVQKYRRWCHHLAILVQLNLRWFYFGKKDDGLYNSRIELVGSWTGTNRNIQNSDSKCTIFLPIFAVIFIKYTLERNGNILQEPHWQDFEMVVMISIDSNMVVQAGYCWYWRRLIQYWWQKDRRTTFIHLHYFTKYWAK